MAASRSKSQSEMAEILRGANALHEELEKARESLKDVDDNIKKLTGRDPAEPNSRLGQRRVLVSPGDGRGGRDRIASLARRTIVEVDGPPTKKRAVGGILSRLGPRPDRSTQDSGEEEELPNKPTVQSSIVATNRDSLTRKDMLEAQGKDSQGMARNRRMFGYLLMGTLQKFRDEARESRYVEAQRKEIEKKLEEKAQQEKEEIRKEREQLFQERRQRQAKIRLLEQKMELVRMHEGWETEIRKLENFIRTKARPHLFYLPKILTPATENKLKDTRRVVQEMINERRRRLEEEIEGLMSQGYKEDNEHELESDVRHRRERASKQGGSRPRERRSLGKDHKSNENKENKSKHRSREKSHSESRHSKRDRREHPAASEETGNAHGDTRRVTQTEIEDSGEEGEIGPIDLPQSDKREVRLDEDKEEGEIDSDTRQVKSSKGGRRVVLTVDADDDAIIEAGYD